MTARKPFLIAIVFLVIAIVAIASSRKRANENETRVATVAVIEGAPQAPAATATAATATTATATPAPQKHSAPATIATNTTEFSDPTPLIASHTTAAAPQIIDTTNPDGDLKNSQLRLNAIEELARGADDLFSTPAVEDSSWTVNQQGLDQQDYRTANADVTAWLGQDESGNGIVRAQEAVMTDGTVVDRWFNDSGGIEQVMRQYDQKNSYSAYYYPSGEIEATRVVKDGAEIFIRYDRDGREIQRSYTPPE